MASQTSNFFYSIANKGQSVANTFKYKRRQPVTSALADIGNQKINNSASSLTRDQRAANVRYGTKGEARQEQIASQSMGRGSYNQQAPRSNRPLGADEFYDAGGVIRKKTSVRNWKDQQKFLTGQYGGFSSGTEFQHFANFNG